MAIEVPCPRCGKLLRAPDELAGKSGRCPECDNSVPIPLAATGAPAAGGAAPDPYAPPRDAPPRDAPGYGGERFSHRDQTITFILSWLVGIFGVDRFYMGQIGLGLLKLLTCGGLGIWALIDTVIIGCGGMRDEDGNSLA